jgi:hypothetical protein
MEFVAHGEAGKLMFPDWFTKPEAIFRTVLWLMGPFFAWLVGKTVLRHVEAWHASRSESAARISLAYLYKALENPPSLLESVAYIVCFLPLPIALTLALLAIYFSPYLPIPPLHSYPHSAKTISETIVSLFFFLNYLLFGVLAVHGVQVAYRLRHGEARYVDNYRAGVQKRIDRLKKKFPQI